MKRKTTILFIWLFLGSTVYSQHSHLDGIFAYVYDPVSGLGGLGDEDKVPSHIQAVFDDLIQAKGDKSTPKPDLIISSSERVAAWAHPAKKIIGLEVKALNICRSMGSDSLDAVASLLAHELIHYYENHDWKNQFVRNYATIADEIQIDQKNY